MIKNQSRNQAVRKLYEVLSLVYGKSVFLKGEMGVGKTYLVKQFCEHHFNAGKEIVSPTFNLIRQKRFNGHEVVHADVYRILDQKERLDRMYSYLADLRGSNTTIFVEWGTQNAVLQPDYLLELFVNHGNNFVCSVTKCC